MNVAIDDLTSAIELVSTVSLLLGVLVGLVCRYVFDDFFAPLLYRSYRLLRYRRLRKVRGF